MNMTGLFYFCDFSRQNQQLIDQKMTNLFLFSAKSLPRPIFGLRVNYSYQVNCPKGPGALEASLVNFS